MVGASSSLEPDMKPADTLWRAVIAGGLYLLALPVAIAADTTANATLANATLTNTTQANTTQVVATVSVDANKTTGDATKTTGDATTAHSDTAKAPQEKTSRLRFRDKPVCVCATGLTEKEIAEGQAQQRSEAITQADRNP